jgi:hypothetical protein
MPVQPEHAPQQNMADFATEAENPCRRSRIVAIREAFKPEDKRGVCTKEAIVWMVYRRV